jgi:tetratricopeptide (TPR) repeat protein
LGDSNTVTTVIHVHIVDVEQGKRILKHKLGGYSHRGKVTALAWSPSGQSLACGGSQGLVEVLDVDSGRLQVSTKPHNAQINALSWSPDGRRLASSSEDRSVKVLGTPGSEELLMFSLEENSPIQLTWSPDGRRLAAATQSGTIHVWDASRGYEFSLEGPRRDELAWAYYQRSRGDGVDRPALREFLRLAPDTLGFWPERGHANARLGEFEQAAREFAKVIGPDVGLSYQPAYYRAFALLGAGDLEVYREVCASLVEHFIDSDVPSNTIYVTWLCVLSPTPPADSKTIVQMARTLYKREPPNDFQSLLIGASLFRNGQYDEAIHTLTTLAEKLERGGDTTDRFELACSQYFLALARHRQGHDFQARRYLTEAKRNSDEYRQITQEWTSLIVLDTLFQETETLLRVKN